MDAGALGHRANEGSGCLSARLVQYVLEHFDRGGLFVEPRQRLRCGIGFFGCGRGQARQTFATLALNDRLKAGDILFEVAPPGLTSPCPAINRFDLAVDRLHIMCGGVACRFGQLDGGLGNILPGLGDGVGKPGKIGLLFQLSDAISCMSLIALRARLRGGKRAVPIL